MMVSAIVARTAIRELWMTFRLLLILVGFVGTAAVLVLLPSAPRIMLGRLALGLGLATIVVSAVAAWSMASERQSGRAGWLVSRSVARAEIVGGWLGGIGLISTAGVVMAGVLGWLAIFSLPVTFDPLVFLVSLGAIAATAAAGVALGLLLGAVLPPLVACAAAIAVTGTVGAAVLLLGPGPFAPGAAFRLVGELGAGSVGLPDALRACGVALLLAGALTAAARLALDRVDL